MTQQELSDKAKIAVSTLSDLEIGINAMPSDHNLIALCDALGCKPGDLFRVLPDGPASSDPPS